MQTNHCCSKKMRLKILWQRNIENVNNYDYNQTSTNESSFDIKWKNEK